MLGEEDDVPLGVEDLEARPEELKDLAADFVLLVLVASVDGTSPLPV
ncbi:MAG: hypothetical protein WEB00_14700 [Dehalococcoidia bacterium]